MHSQGQTNQPTTTREQQLGPIWKLRQALVLINADTQSCLRKTYCDLRLPAQLWPCCCAPLKACRARNPSAQFLWEVGLATYRHRVGHEDSRGVMCSIFRLPGAISLGWSGAGNYDKWLLMYMALMYCDSCSCTDVKSGTCHWHYSSNKGSKLLSCST
jgi:hypothetical protein